MTRALQHSILTQDPVTSDEAISLAKQIGASGYFETSAKEKQGVDELFTEATRIACLVRKLKGLFTNCFENSSFFNYAKF